MGEDNVDPMTAWHWIGGSRRHPMPTPMVVGQRHRTRDKQGRGGGGFHIQQSTKTGSDSGSDSGNDSGSNSGNDSGSNSGSNSGSDSGSDSSSDSGRDSGGNGGCDGGGGGKQHRG